MARVQGFKELKLKNRMYEPMHDASRFARVENVEIDHPTDDDPSMEYDSADNDNGAEQGSNNEDNDTYSDPSEDDKDHADETGKWEPDEDHYEQEKFNPIKRHLNDDTIIDHGNIGPGSNEVNEPSKHSDEDVDDEEPSEHSNENSQDEHGDIKENHDASIVDNNDSDSEKNETSSIEEVRRSSPMWWSIGVVKLAWRAM